MKPHDIGKAYDQITHLWENDGFARSDAVEQHKRAIAFTKAKGRALNVGCGCSGHIMKLLTEEGFVPEGLDVSKKMIALAREKLPEIAFSHGDICEWEISRTYHFITAWDSLWHIPLSQQEAVLEKLISALNPDGVLIFSFGGTDARDEHANHFMGPEVYYATLGVQGYLQLILNLGCYCRHLEYDQHPRSHAYMIVQKA